jgi:signal transduction histidine kinase
MQRNGHVETASTHPAPGSWLALAGLKNTPMPARLGLTALLLACVYALLSTPAAYTSRPDTLAAIIWPAPAVAAALLWNMPYRRWPIFLLAVFLAMLFVGDADPLSLGADAAFALLNVFEVALYAFLGRRVVCENGNIDTTAKLARFIVFLPLLATALIAALGATIGMVTKHSSWTEEWRVILVGNGLAVLVLLPALLSWCSGQARAAQSIEKPGTALVAAVLCACLLAASALVAGFPSEVLRVLLSLVLVWAAIRGGLRAASLGILAAAAVGVGMAMAGYGPYSAVYGHDGTWELQVDLAGLAVLSFFVAIAVHERQKLNLRLERARRFETMGFLTGGIAHDFNNILGAVGGYAELAVEREKAGLTVQAALEEVSAAVSRGKDLTEQILIAGRRGARTREAADLRELIAEAIATVRPLLPPGVGLVVRVPAAPVPVLAHRGQLTRAIMNLLRNASQAAGGKVELSLSAADTHAQAYARDADTVVGDVLNEGCVWLDVLDDGAGVAPQHIHQLFDPFFSSRSQQGGSKGHGTGLGLAIVAGVAADHEGGVAVWSGHGQKTRFCLTLPLLLPAEEIPALPVTPAAPLGSGEIAVVIAQDPEARERAEDALALLGFEPAGYAPSGMTAAGLQELGGHAELLVWIVSPGAPDSLLAGLHEHVPGVPLIRCVAEGEEPGITQAAGMVTIAGSVDGPALRQAVKMATGRSDSQPAQHEGKPQP